MKSLILILSLTLVPFTALAQVQAASPAVPDMNDYVWGFPVIVQEESSFYLVQLPLAVNRSTTDPRLRDVGVYNADGEPVPRVIRPFSDDAEPIERNRQLPFVPLFEDVEGDNGEEIRLLLERTDASTKLQVATGEAIGESVSRELRSYVVDAHQDDEAIEALDLFWTQTGSDFIGQITVEGSDDLASWSALGSAAIADLNENSTSIVQRRVELSDMQRDYLRISWRGLPDDWRLAEVLGAFTQGAQDVARENLLLDHPERDPQDGGRIFSLGGAPTIDRLRIRLPQSNTVITADTYLWSESQGRWNRVARGSWHHIGQSVNIIESEPISIPRTRSDRIKVVVTRGQPDVDMQLEVGWRPDKLLFLAQGAPPFTLVAGRAADAAAGFPQHSIYGVGSITSLAEDSSQATAAALGSRYSLSGPGQLHVDEATDWRTLLLWLGLAFGVGFVGFMATRLLRR